MPESPTELIERLGAADERARRAAGDALLRRGQAGADALASALGHPSARVRQSAAFLLGRMGSRPADLARALEDADPKVRKNAAVALGRAGGEAELDALSAALAREEVAWVRPSLVLAAGAIGGPSARAALAHVVPQSDEEREALGKASERTGEGAPPAAWHAGGRLPPALLEAPPGLERVAADELAALGLPRPRADGPGRLRLAESIAAPGLVARLRCASALLLELAIGPPLALAAPQRCAQQLGDMIGASPALARWGDWLSTPDGQLRVRVAVAQRVRAEAFRAILAGVRAAGAPLGIVDSPSRYQAELLIESDARAARLLLRPAFEPDARFAYRLRDVPAAIDPVTAAGLARMLATGPSAIVFDPTCGSGTLLAERGMLGAARLVGLDQSGAAVAAARENLAAAGLAGRAQVGVGDAADRRRWPDCDEVIANLPFGLRTGGDARELEQLYRAIAANLSSALRPGGRALLYTTRAPELRRALSASGPWQIAESTVRSGGLLVHALVVARAGERR